MERAVWLAAATWLGGVGAWGVGTGYALCAARARHLTMGSDDAPTPPVDTIDVSSLPAPPLPLDAPNADSARRPARASSPPTVDSLAEMEEFLLRQDAKRANARVVEVQSASADEFSDTDEYSDVGSDADESAMTARRREPTEGDRPPKVSFELDVAPPDASALMSESQRRRLAPIKPVKRERRSRKIRVAPPKKDDVSIPLVRGARATQDEAILNAFNGQTLDVKREQGEDYWVDPDLVESEVRAKERGAAKAKKLKDQAQNFGEQRLRAEIAAPYKNNVIGGIVLGVGVLAVVFAQFPQLLELNAPGSIASFPAEL